MSTFATIYRHHHTFVWQSLRCLGVPDRSLDDATQDVFLVVHRRLGEFEGRSSIKTWLFEILRRVAWRYRWRTTREAARTVELPQLVSPLDLDESTDRARALELLQAFLARLDDDRVAVFVLAEFGQLRGREIAAALDVNLNTVYARLRSARLDLDRMAARVQSRERAGLVGLVRADEPPAAARRRTWTALSGELLTRGTRSLDPRSWVYGECRVGPPRLPCVSSWWQRSEGSPRPSWFHSIAHWSEHRRAPHPWLLSHTLSFHRMNGSIPLWSPSCTTQSCSSRARSLRLNPHALW